MADPKVGSSTDRIDLFGDPSAPGSSDLADLFGPLPPRPGEFVKGVKRGGFRLAAEAARTGEAVATKLDQPGAKEIFGNIAEAANEKSGRFGARVSDPFEIRGLDDFTDYAAGLFGEQAVQLPITALAAVVGARLGRKFSPADKVLGNIVGASAGASVPSYIQNFGDIYGEQREIGIDNPETAAKWALPVAALDAVGPGMFFGLLRNAGKAVSEKGVKELFKKILAGSGLGVLEEAPTEALQEALAIQARSEVDPDFETDSPENRRRIAAAGIGGGLIGLGIGGAGGAANAVLAPSGDGRAEAPVSTPAQDLQEDLQSPVPVPTANDITPEISALSESIGLREEDGEQFALDDPLNSPDVQLATAERDEFTERLKESDAEFAASPEATTARFLRDMVPDIEAEIQVLDKESRSKAKGRRESGVIAAEKAALVGQLEAVQNRAGQLETLITTPEYQPKSTLVQGTLLSVNQAPSVKSEDLSGTFTEQLGRLKAARGELRTAAEIKAVSKADKSIADAALPVVTAQDRARSRSTVAPKNQAAEDLRARQTDSIKSNVQELVENNLVTSGVATSMSTTIGRAVDAAEKLTDPAAQQETIIKGIKKAIRGKITKPADAKTVIDKITSELTQLTPQIQDDKALRSNRPKVAVPTEQQSLLNDGIAPIPEEVIQFEHFGNVPGGVTDPGKIGTGAAGRDQALASEVGLQYTSAIVAGSEFNAPGIKQKAKFTGVLSGDKVYPARNDDPLLAEARADLEAQGIVNENLAWMNYAKAVRDLGFDAIQYAGGQLRIFTPQQVSETFSLASAKKKAGKVVTHHKKSGGGTWNLVTGQELGGTYNYSVSPYKGREVIIEGNPTPENIRDYIEANEDLLANPANVLGTWYNAEDGNTYIDVSVVTPSYNQAQAIAKKNNQIAFFNLRTFEEIPTEAPQPEQVPLFRNVNEFVALDSQYHAKAVEALEFLESILGTPRNLKVKVFTGEGQSPSGIYQKGELKDVISLAKNASDVGSVAAHEGFHFLEERVLTGGDKAILGRSFAKNSTMFKRLQTAALEYDRVNGTSIVDEINAIPAEARAYGYEFWKRGELQANGVLERVFEFIKSFLERLSNGISQHGFNTAQDIFMMIDRGVYARREIQALRVEDHTGDSWINDIEPDAIPGLQKAGSKTMSNTASSTARGRPPWVKSGNAVAAMRRQIRALALEGEDGKHWHFDSAQEILSLYDGDIKKSQTLAKLIALFSPSTRVGGDLMHAFKAIEQWSRGETITAGIFPNKMRPKAEEALRGLDFEGLKTSTFYRNLMAGIDPANFNAEIQGATIDMWMAYAFGFETRSGKITTAQYRYAEAEVGKLARELGWTIEETQAAIWVSTKARWETMRAEQNAWAEKNGLMEAAPSKDPSRAQKKVPRRVAKEHQGQYFRHWKKISLSITREQIDPRKRIDSKFNYGDAIRAVRGGELVPDSVLDLQVPDTNGMDESQIALESDEDVGVVSLKYYSKASLADLITMTKRGEIEGTQMHSVIAGMIDESNIPEDVQKQVFGNTIRGYTKGVTGSLKTFYDENISSGLNLARKSLGFKNVFDVLTKYTQRKNRLIADSVDTQLSEWREGSSTAQMTNVTKALLDRTVNGYLEDSPELGVITSKLSEKEAAMFKQATDMIKNRLLAEFEADKSSYATLLGEDSADYAQWLSNRSTQVNQLIDEGYFPERRFGDHGVHMYMEVGGKRITLAYELDKNRGTAEKRVEILSEVMKNFPEIKTEYAFKYKAEFDGSISFQQFLDVANRQGIALTQAEKERVAKALVASDSVRRNRIFRRKNIPGFSEDGMRILAEFAVTMSNKIAYAEFGSAIQDALSGKVVESSFDAAGTPTVNVSEDTNTWSQDGELGGFYHNLSDKTADFVLSPRPGNKISSTLRAAATFQFLGGSLAAGGIQLTSLAMNTTPYFTQHTSYTDSMSKTLAGLKIAVSNSRNLTNIAKLQDESVKIPDVDSVPGLRQALTVAAQDGTTLDTEIYQIMGLTRGKLLAQSRNVQRALNGWMAPFRITEQWNRISTFIAGYNIGTNNGLSGDELYKFSQKAVYDTQFRYDEANRPAIARGPWGAMLFTFKTYPIFMLELMNGLSKENPKAAVIMLLSLTAMSGVEGLPFAENLEDLIDTIAQRVFGSTFNTKRAMRNMFKDASEAMVGVDLSGWAMHGMANQITGLNFANRVGLGKLIPGTRIGVADADYKQVMGEILGPAGAVAQGYLMGLDQLSRGEINKAAKVALPLGARNVIKGVEQWSSGFAQDIGGRNIVPVNNWEAFWQSLGFSSNALTSAYDVDRIDRSSVAFYQQAKRQITNDIVKAVRRGDSTATTEAVEAIKSWNKTNPDMPMVINGPSLRRTIALAGLPLNQRSLLLLPRALRGSSESLKEIYGTDR